MKILREREVHENDCGQEKTGIETKTTEYSQSYPKLWERLLLTEGIEHARFAAGTPAVETMVFLDYVKLF